MGIKLSISSYIAGKSPEAAVKRIARAGFHYAELGAPHSAMLLERSPEEWKEFREFARQEGIEFGQGHLPLHNFITDKDETSRRANVEIHRRYCRMYHALGITAPVLHCGGYREIHAGEDPAAVRAIRIKSLKELLSDLPEGMCLCLENLPDETFEDVFANLEEMGFPENLGLCLDTGHLHFSPAPDHESFILRAGKHLKALHLHDNPGPMAPDGVLKLSGWLGSDKHMMPGFFAGSINWYKVTAALRAINYDRLWNMEIGAELGVDTPNQRYRDMILRHNCERGELIFNHDPEAPDPEDPVNDYSSLEKISSAGVSAEVDKYSLKISAPAYELAVDPVHGGRIYRWDSAGHTIIPQCMSWGWGVAGVITPLATAFHLTRGMKIDSLKAVPEGIELAMSKVLDCEDNDVLQGVTFAITDTFTADGFTRQLKITNTAGKKLPVSCFRIHCLPDLLGGPGLPAGRLEMSDGAVYDRNHASFCFRLTDEPDQMIEKALRCTVIPSRGEKVFLSALGFKGRLEISFSGVTPAYIFCWDSRSNICSLEPVFSPCALEPGEERIYGMTVKHTGI